jgi:hypothetical protein
VARFVLRYAEWTRRPPEEVEAADVRREGAWLVLEHWTLVLDRPRCVVALRVLRDEVRELRQLP